MYPPLPVLKATALAKAVFDNSPNMITVMDVEGRYMALNPKAEEILGVVPGAAIGHQAQDLIPEDIAEQILIEDQRVLDAELPLTFEHHFETMDGMLIFEVTKFPVFDDDDCLVGVCAVGVDITTRKTAEGEVHRRVNYDPLTDLPNRLLFADRLEQAMAGGDRAYAPVGVLYVDLDNFSAVNNTLGTVVGDQLLVEAAWRLASCVRNNDTVARLSGDEFGIVLPNLDSSDDAQLVARKILSAFSAPVAVGDHEIFISVSIGIAVYSEDGKTVDDLLRNAALAMHRAKRRGRSCVQRFSAEISEDLARQQRIESALKRALERGELSVVYQPLVSAESHAVVAAEALLRWESATLGAVSPNNFIPVCEETGLINDIGEYVLRQACRDAVRWNEGRYHPVAVSVNVSPRQLLVDRFADIVVSVLRETRLPPRLLKLEITESGLLDNMERCLATFAQLRELGIQLSLDDFGTGYSALGYLQKFEFDVLKLDRSFIRDIVDGSEKVQVAESIIHMAKRLGLKVVAEGVENEAQIAFLSANGCELIQGFYFSAPKNFDEFSTYMGAAQSIAA